MAFEINLLTMIVMAALGAMSAYLANQNIAVFNDGLRPVYMQYFDKTIDRRTLFATSFALSFGLVIGFGIPTSIAGKIIIVHTILLAADIIGTLFNDDTKGMIVSTVLGAAFGLALLFGMQFIVDVFKALPIDFTGSLATVGSLITIGFTVFPALAVAYQAGAIKGMIVLVLTMLAKQLTVLFGTIKFNDFTVALNADGMALLVGIILMVFFAATAKKEKGSSMEATFAIFEKNIERIRKNLIVLAISGGIVALATTLLLIAEGPASLTLMAEGQYNEAAMIALGRALGFIPLVMTTAIISGVYSPAGTKLVHVPAILLINAGIMGMAGSFVIGSLIMLLEVLLIGILAKGMNNLNGIIEKVNILIILWLFLK